MILVGDLEHLIFFILRVRMSKMFFSFFSVSVNMINITRLTLSHNKIQGMFGKFFQYFGR